MASDNENNVTTTFNLDVKDALASLQGLQDKLGVIGDAEGLQGLTSSLMEIGLVAAPLAAGFFAVKEAMDAVFDAEKIKAVSAQFEVFAAQAGQGASELKEEMIKAAGGLADTNEVLAATNKALVEMPINAAKIPEVMEMARKVTAVFGGTLVDNFENINQAVASGNMRMLKNMGIIVDTEKAVRDYAAANGIAESAISQAGKQQALLNAVLEKGQSTLSGVNTDVLAATNAWTQLKVALTDIKESLTLVVDKLFGDAVKSGINSLAVAANTAKLFFESTLGTGAEKAAASVELTNKQIADLENRITMIQKHPDLFADSARTVDDLRKRIDELRGSLIQADNVQSAMSEKMAARRAAKSEGGGGGALPGVPSKEDQAKAKELTAKFMAEMAQIRSKDADLDKRLATNREQVEQDVETQILELRKKTSAEIQKIEESKDLNNQQKSQLIRATKRQEILEEQVLRKQMADQDLATQQKMLQDDLAANNAEIESSMNVDRTDELLAQNKSLREKQLHLEIDQIRQNTALTTIQQEQMIANAKRKAASDEVQLDMKTRDAEIRSLNNYVKANQNAMRGIAASWKATAMTEVQQTANVASMGGVAFNAFSQTASQSLVGLAEGSGISWAKMRGQILHTIGEEGVAKGTVMMLEGIFPPNPAAIAGGAALTGVGMALIAASGVGGASTPSVSASPATNADQAQTASDNMVAASSAPAASASTSPAMPDVAQNQRQQRVVNLQIQGNYFETDQTRRQLMEMIRNETDATDFRYARIGES